jgi:hypothetical protein
MGERSFFRELFPEIERLDLACPRKKTRHRPQRLRVLWTKFISGSRFLVRFRPIFLVDVAESFLSVAARLPGFDRARCRTDAQKHEPGRQHKADDDDDDFASPELLEAPFLGGQHEVGVTHGSRDPCLLFPERYFSSSTLMSLGTSSTNFLSAAASSTSGDETNINSITC